MLEKIKLQSMKKKITPPFEAAGSMCLLSDQYFA